jgi:hypothetical protein
MKPKCGRGSRRTVTKPDNFCLAMVTQIGHVSNFFRIPSIESRKMVERYRAAFADAA